MPLPLWPLAQKLAAGWPAGLALALLAGGRLAARRRRAALNRALHELRRPLQVMALAPPRAAASPGALELALAAVDDLDREINGAPTRPELRPIWCRALVEQAVERWRGPAAAKSRTLELRWQAGSPRVLADPARLAQALDNLIANALEHGGIRVRVEATRARSAVRIVVADSAASLPPRRPARDPRRSHGLGVVARIAAEHRGRFALARSRSETRAALELPLAPPT